jgi:hypothetical protein
VKTAPTKIEINVNHQDSPAAQECKWMSDCEFSKSCRDRGDGVHLGLGNEARGGYCEFSTDCSSSLFCREVSNKIKKCM